jgi:hypothetical protein
MSLVEILSFLGTAVVSTIVGIYVTRLHNTIKIPFLTSERKRSLRGCWHGIYKQDENSKRKATDLELELHLEPKLKIIQGKMIVKEINRKTSSFDNTYRFEVIGYFLHDRFLQLNYKCCGKSSKAIDIGSLFLKVSDSGGEMHGRLAGWGSISEDVISGTITLEWREIKEED